MGGRERLIRWVRTSPPMRALTPTNPPQDVPDWVYDQWFEEYEEQRDAQARGNIVSAFQLRDRDERYPEDDGEDGWQVLDQVRRLIHLSADMGLVSRSILRPLAQALDPATRMANAAQVEATKLEAERLGVDLRDDLEPSDY